MVLVRVRDGEMVVEGSCVHSVNGDESALKCGGGESRSQLYGGGHFCRS